MIRIESHLANCDSCNHLGFCEIYWGAECKRQGGKKTPRLKSMHAKAKLMASNNEQKQPVKRVVEVAKMSEPIRTRVVNW